MEVRSKIEELNNRDEPIREILGKEPRWIILWGNSLILLFSIGLLAISIIIRYPEIIYVKAKLISINAPKEVITKTAGKLIKLFAKENDQTEQGEILGYMESTASHQDIIHLSSNIDTSILLFDKNNFQIAFSLLNNKYSNLGELQRDYQSFFTAYQSFKDYLTNGFYLRKKNMLTSDLSYFQKMHTNLLQQKELNTKDLALQQKTFDAYQSLKENKVISELEYRSESSKLINKKLTLPQITSSIINNEVLQNAKLKEIAELENTITQQRTIFEQALNTFKSQIADWKKKYLLIAPIDGKITFATFLQENQQLQANQIICFITPENTQYYAEIYVPQTNLGKVKIGQVVLLKFPSYPFQEYGSINGKIDFISNINTDSGYLAKATLPNGLNTSYTKRIQFREGLEAQGEIITQNMRLLQRFYQNIRKQFKK